MIRPAEAYRQGLREGRKVWMDNEPVADVARHPAFKPIIGEQFARAPHFNHLAAVHNSCDFNGPLDFVHKAASLSDQVTIPAS